MPYNYHPRFLRPPICTDCRNALAVAAVTCFQQQFNEKVRKLVVDLGRKTVICGNENRSIVYEWEDLGFIGCQCPASDQASGA